MEEILERAQKLDILARQVFKLARDSLLLKMRFLDLALFRLDLVSSDIHLATNGQFLYYQPEYLLRRYKTEKNAVVRDYMHVLLHCIFWHPFVSPALDPQLWDLACDMAVESAIIDMELPLFQVNREGRQMSALTPVAQAAPTLTADKIYRYLQEARLGEEELARLKELFYSDDHRIWYERKKENRDDLTDKEDESEDQGEGPGSSSGASGEDEGESQEGNGDSQENDDNPELGQGEGQPRPGRASMTLEELKRQWQDISEHIVTDMETYSQMQGTGGGNMNQQLLQLTRERYDYAWFLKRFAVLGEAMQVNDDEFDYIFYTYGLKLYKRMPLIEPLEYKEVKRIRDFAIAIDTSGSVQGSLVQSFIQKTYNILRSEESFFTKINLHIIQCDAEIQEAVRISSREEFEDYIRTMELKGFGGTDFRPVFAYLNDRIQEGAFNNFKGLIYFTDGYGTFPEHKPDYEAAFVFLRSEYDNPWVPPWAIKLVLDDNEIREWEE